MQEIWDFARRLSDQGQTLRRQTGDPRWSITELDLAEHELEWLREWFSQLKLPAIRLYAQHEKVGPLFGILFLTFWASLCAEGAGEDEAWSSLKGGFTDPDVRAHLENNARYQTLGCALKQAVFLYGLRHGFEDHLPHHYYMTARLNHAISPRMAVTFDPTHLHREGRELCGDGPNRSRLFVALVDAVRTRNLPAITNNPWISPYAIERLFGAKAVPDRRSTSGMNPVELKLSWNDHQPIFCIQVSERYAVPANWPTWVRAWVDDTPIGTYQVKDGHLVPWNGEPFVTNDGSSWTVRFKDGERLVWEGRVEPIPPDRLAVVYDLQTGRLLPEGSMLRPQRSYAICIPSDAEGSTALHSVEAGDRTWVRLDAGWPPGLSFSIGGQEFFSPSIGEGPDVRVRCNRPHLSKTPRSSVTFQVVPPPGWELEKIECLNATTFRCRNMWICRAELGFLPSARLVFRVALRNEGRRVICQRSIELPRYAAARISGDGWHRNDKDDVILGDSGLLSLEVVGGHQSRLLVREGDRMLLQRQGGIERTIRLPAHLGLGGALCAELNRDFLILASSIISTGWIGTVEWNQSSICPTVRRKPEGQATWWIWDDAGVRSCAYVDPPVTLPAKTPIGIALTVEGQLVGRALAPGWKWRIDCGQSQTCARLAWFGAVPGEDRRPDWHYLIDPVPPTDLPGKGMSAAWSRAVMRRSTPNFPLPVSMADDLWDHDFRELALLHPRMITAALESTTAWDPWTRRAKLKDRLQAVGGEFGFEELRQVLVQFYPELRWPQLLARVQDPKENDKIEYSGNWQTVAPEHLELVVRCLISLELKRVEDRMPKVEETYESWREDRGLSGPMTCSEFLDELVVLDELPIAPKPFIPLLCRLLNRRTEIGLAGERMLMSQINQEGNCNHGQVLRAIAEEDEYKFNLFNCATQVRKETNREDRIEAREIATKCIEAARARSVPLPLARQAEARFKVKGGCPPILAAAIVLLHLKEDPPATKS